MRICIVYDCLYPSTVGGAERWYRSLAEALAGAGHEVTYLTMRQWDHGEAPVIPGVAIVAVAPRRPLYTANGRRRIAPPLLFGLGVLRHLRGRGRRYDVVHAASFPYFSLLAAGAARRRWGYRLAVDWHELWSPGYWREYLGPLGGRIGAAVQRRCLAVPQHAFCFSAQVEGRLRSAGVHGEVTRLAGLYAGTTAAAEVLPAALEIVYAGRHIPEKQVPALIPAFQAARERIPGLRCRIFGDGPERAEVLRLIEAGGLGAEVEAPGFVDEQTLDSAVERALCFVLPSRREGYGIAVVEAAARGTPSVVVAGENNATMELIEEGVNGVVAASASAGDLADAIVRVHAAGDGLRHSTAAWFRGNAERLSLERSVDIVGRFYASR